ncbi:conserved membrane hypothetical protein [Candidatus Nitrotoga sp. HW29]|uniref:hypothetical protein n=1 Tax=Candidatus Nitrotoga sp. HW29 TaxID=2886963 RepID=UPI001EF34896|nr:hypothetical protein [Candidatus Nitrotoga sp. HW29]CAH1904826.1 conserved membrane hypothetical protein [Candidatus Nitrotoga sp. HW29]
MELFTLMAGLCLPWLLGIAWLRAPWLKATGITWPTLLGYGYLGGILLTTLVMRLLDTLGIRLGFFSIGLTLLLLTLAGAWLGRKEPWRIRLPGADWHSLAGWRKIVYAVLLAAILIRLTGLGLEIVWRPLFPWDAWSQWATKARVWYELGHLATFVPADVWLGGELTGAYTDAAPYYPPVIPLIQVWMSYSLGRWDDTLMNLPWLLCAIALGLAFYGQARQWQISPLFALMFSYFLLSLPILDVHVALAGYADLFMGAFYGLAAMAFFHWIRTRDFWQGTMALLFGLGCILIKQPGIAWALTFLPALLIVVMPRAGLVGTAMLAAAGVATLFVLEDKDFHLFGYHVHLRFAADWHPFWQNMMVMDNWHLFWYLVVAALVLSFPRLLAPAYRSMTVLLLSATSFLAIVFFFTHAHAWAEDYTTINRALLHIVPMLLFYVMVLFQEAIHSPRIMATAKN